MPVDKKTLQNAAQNMMDRYGETALTEINLRISELRSRNQFEALELWMEIRKTFELLMSPSTEDTKH